MKRKSVTFIYETRNKIKNLNETVKSYLKDLQENGRKVLDVKTCLNSENDILVTIIYEFDICLQVIPESIK